PFLPLQLGLHNQAAQLLSGLIGMSVRRAFQFLESWQPMLLVTPYPLVSRRPANPIDSAKLAFAVISTQPICYQLNSLVHRTGFLPRHRHPPPGRCNVNHVPGLFCKRSYRFVPHRFPLPLGEGQGEGLATQQPFSSSSRACANENNKEMNSRSLLLTPHPGPLPLGEGQKLFGRNFPSGMLFSKLNSRR